MVTDKQKANLIPFSEQSKSEAREKARNGGIKSGQARREKRDFKTSLKWMLGLPLSRKEQKDINAKLGSTGSLTQADAVAFAVLTKARKGEPQHLRLVSELIGALKDEGNNNTINITYSVPGAITSEMQSVTAKLRSKRKSRTDIDEPNE